MTSLFPDATPVQNDDVVRIADRRETVSDDDTGAVAHQFADGILNQMLGLRVDVGRGFVEDQYFGLECQSPGD